MSSDESRSRQRSDVGSENGADGGDSVASKLSKELSNWRRKRTSGRPHRPEGSSSGGHSEPARTIKVRGHETLVIRKPKIAPKTQENPEPSEG